MAELIGKIFDRKYKIVRLIGVGGMGSVYVAEHTRINRKVALKVMHRDSATDPEAVSRFLREATAASEIGHPNIVEIFDVGVEEDGTAYIVMELLTGVSLDQILRERHTVPPNRAVSIILQVLSALHAAHKKGIVHRDLKPDNVFISVDARDREEVKLLDFGVAKVQKVTEASLRLTKTGTVLGTPSYIAPEQARGRKDIDHRIDIWAAGVMLYEMLCGELPFKGDNYNEVMSNILIEESAPLYKVAPQVPESLTRVVEKAMTKDRSKRYQSVVEMIQELLPFYEQEESEMTPKALEMLTRSVPPAPSSGAQAPAESFPVPPPSMEGEGRLLEAPESHPAGADKEANNIGSEFTFPGETIEEGREPTLRRAALSQWLLARRSPLVVASGATAAILALVVLAVWAARSTEAPPGKPTSELRPASGGDAQRAETNTKSKVGENRVLPKAVTSAKPPAAPLASPEAKNQTVNVALTGLPADARVTLGGELIQPPMVIERSDQPMPLEITAPGYLSWRKMITPDRDQILTISMRKKRSMPSASFPSKPAAIRRGKQGKGETKLLSNPFK